MYIAPSSNVRLLRGCPCDANYSDTLYFANQSAQFSYFSGLTKYNLTNQMYTRVDKGVFRADIPADNLWDVNYIMFQNTAFGNKWFYAFVDTIEYVNNGRSDVHFTIDAIQTWMFDYTLNQCFVEREHTLTDIIGEHRVPENFNTSDYVFQETHYDVLNTDITELWTAVQIIDVDTSEHGGLYDGIYSGSVLAVFDTTDDDEIEKLGGLLQYYIQQPDAIGGMYMIPKFTLPTTFHYNYTLPKYNPATDTNVYYNLIPLYSAGRSVEYPLTGMALTNTDTLDGYLPKNKKLLTYPYTFLNIDNGNDQSLQLMYEFFADIPYVHLHSNLTPPVSIVLLPSDYMGSGSHNVNPLKSISISGYPHCSWSNDTYTAWLAQNSVPMAISGVTDMIGGIASIASGNVMGGAMSMARTVGNMVSEGYRAAIASDVENGDTKHGNVCASSGLLTFHIGRMSIRAEQAKIIDQYFDMFGYSCREVKVPNTHSRPHWNYVKTIGCTINGSVPADDERTITSIYDNGIRFWKHASELGNFSLDNSPTT